MPLTCNKQTLTLTTDSGTDNGVFCLGLGVVLVFGIGSFTTTTDCRSARDAREPSIGASDEDDITDPFSSLIPDAAGNSNSNSPGNSNAVPNPGPNPSSINLGLWIGKTGDEFDLFSAASSSVCCRCRRRRRRR
jgi:hypothetical protein